MAAPAPLRTVASGRDRGVPTCRSSGKAYSPQAADLPQPVVGALESLAFQGCVEAFAGGIVGAGVDRAHRPCDPELVAEAGEGPGTYCAPWTEWNTAPSRPPREFRNDAVALYRAAAGKRTYAAVAADLGITAESLRTWVRKDEAQAVPTGRDGSVSAAQELARLRAENARPLKAEQEWRLEREILRRAAAYFAREMK